MQKSARLRNPLAWLTIVGLLYAAYFVLRYGGLWIENDTAVFSMVTTQWIHSGKLPTGAYPHGFGYQAWLSTLALLTGLDANTANTLVAPFLGVIMVIVPAYLCYYALLKTESRAIVAGLMLFTIPELMFSILRGNHEKLSICFFVMGLYSFLKALQSAHGGDRRSVTLWTVFYYVLVFANTSVNDYFASTVVFATIPTTLVVLVLARKSRPNKLKQFLLGKLVLSVITSYLVVVLVMFFIFPEAGQDFLLAKSAGQKVQDLFLTMHASSNPYTVVTQAWAGSTASMLMSSFRRLLLGLSFISLMIHVRGTMRKNTEIPSNTALLVASYVSFGLIIIISVPIDFSGLAAGSNLEVRNYTYFAVIAIPMIASTPLKVLHREWLRKAAYSALAVGLMCFLLIGLLKTSLDPIVSNDWIFYTKSESQGLQDFLSLTDGASLWAGSDNRLVNLAEVLDMNIPSGDQVAGFFIQSRPQIRYILWSPQVQAQVTVQQMVAPNIQEQNRIYDNGGAEIYQLRPQTPFQ